MPDRDAAEMVVDVLVVGAGPAGAAAGIEATRLGLRVLVADKAEFPRDKTCGDGLTAHALRLLDHLGVNVRALPSYAPVHEAVLVAPHGREVRLPLPSDGSLAAVVPRTELDAALVDRARARGVEVREGVELRAVRADGVTMVAEIGDHRDRWVVRADWVIAADGHYSAVRRSMRADAPRDLGTWHAFRQYFRRVADDRLWVLFDEDLLPGYAWVFPLGGGRANVGFGVLRDRRGRAPAVDGKHLAALWRDVVDRPGVRRILGPDAEPDGPHRAWPIPAALDARTLAGPGRVLFAGDAANVVDPLTGEGIAQALETGRLAARAIATGMGTSEAGVPAVADRYRADVDRALGVDLRFASALQRVLCAPMGARAAIGAAALNPWTRRNFARWMFEDYPRALVLTPRRWRR